MNVYDKLGVRTLLNAADSYTILGGSVMPPEVMQAMEEASRHFVMLEELHDRVGEELARLTRNEAAMVTSGASAGLAIATAGLVTGRDITKTRKFPHLEGMKDEVIVLRCQRNGFDLAISQTGAKLVEVGDVESTFDWQLEAAIGEQTAGVFYFDSTTYSRGALPLDTVIRIAAARGVPVVVDSAAQLPPMDNLWRYTEMGADLVIFSGGKTLRGPQSSGFIVGRRELVAACRLNAGPAISIGRPMKVGKEEMCGLLAAVERYVGLDHAAEELRFEAMVERAVRELAACGYRTRRVYPGPTGQHYPRAAVSAGERMTGAELQRRLAEGAPSVWVAHAPEMNWDCSGGANFRFDGIFLNPLHLSDDDFELVLNRMKALIAESEEISP